MSNGNNDWLARVDDALQREHEWAETKRQSAVGWMAAARERSEEVQTVASQRRAAATTAFKAFEIACETWIKDVVDQVSQELNKRGLELITNHRAEQVRDKAKTFELALRVRYVGHSWGNGEVRIRANEATGRASVNYEVQSVRSGRIDHIELPEIRLDAISPELLNTHLETVVVKLLGGT